jgi:hypothetical protein
MSGSNFTHEIQQAMKPTLKEGSKKEERGESKSLERKELASGIDKPNAGKGKPTPNPHPGMKSDNATASAPPSPHQFKSPQPQAQGQQGLTQAVDQFSAHMMPHGPSMPQSSGLQQAHSQIVNALAQRDMMKGH